MKTLINKSTTQLVKEIKHAIDLDVEIDVQYCHPDSWSGDNYDQFCSFVSNLQMSERAIREHLPSFEEMDRIFGEGEWGMEYLACEVYEAIAWERLSKHNDRCWHHSSKSIWWPESASIGAHISELTAYDTPEDREARALEAAQQVEALEQERKVLITEYMQLIPKIEGESFLETRKRLSAALGKKIDPQVYYRTVKAIRRS